MFNSLFAKKRTKKRKKSYGKKRKMSKKKAHAKIKSLLKHC